MSNDKIYIAISKKEIEREIEMIVREYTKRLVNYDYVKNVFYNELRKFASSKIKKTPNVRKAY